MIPVRVLLALLAAVVFAIVFALLHPQTHRRETIHVGTRTLTSCGPRDGVAVWGFCDVMRVPLDWNDPRAGTIGIRFE